MSGHLTAIRGSSVMPTEIFLKYLRSRNLDVTMSYRFSIAIVDLCDGEIDIFCI
jgi:hypothetical protein